MIELGKQQHLQVLRSVSFGLFLGAGDESVLLPAKYVPPGTQVGDRLRVFVYNDSEGRPIATT